MSRERGRTAPAWYPSAAARTGARGETQHSTAEGTWPPATRSQRHISSRGAEGGARGVCWRGVHPVGRWLGPCRGRDRGKVRASSRRRGAAGMGGQLAACGRGVHFPTGCLKSFPFVETKILCKEEKDKSVRDCGRRTFSLLQCWPVPAREPKPWQCPSARHEAARRPRAGRGGNSVMG